ncbi:PQQ-binding-like beta-propeller repeat protein [bacterium]|nr:PQQ-binding-like beta-propeller repeat protein [bacterium]
MRRLRLTIFTLAIATLVLTGCSGHSFTGAAPTSNQGRWLGFGGGSERRFSTDTAPETPLVEAWRFESGVCPWGMTVHRGVAVYAGLQYGIFGLDAATGERIWSWTLPASPAAAPEIAGDHVYLAVDLPLGEIWCLDLLDGVRLWRRLLEELPQGLVADEGGVWVLTTHYLHRFRALDGELLEEHELPGRPLAGPLALWMGEPVLLMKGLKGTGLWGPAWEEPVWFEGEPAVGPVVTGEGVLAWLNRSGELGVYMGSEEGPLFYQTPLTAPPAGIASAPEGLVLLGRDRSLVVADIHGEMRPVLEPTTICLTPPVVTGGLVWIVEAEGDLSAVDLVTGEEVYRHPTDKPVQGLALLNGGLLVTTADGAGMLLVPAPSEIDTPTEEAVDESTEGNTVEDSSAEGADEEALDVEAETP